MTLKQIIGTVVITFEFKLSAYMLHTVSFDYVLKVLYGSSMVDIIWTFASLVSAYEDSMAQQSKVAN